MSVALGIINKSEAVKKAKKEANDEILTKKEKKELTDAEKEYKSLRKQIQDKLIKFATRVPVFMYLTDYRERSLKDVITQLEPGLFKKVTGLSVKDFELLISLGVFNSALMNDAVYKFKRYEDASLEYIGINRHEGEDVGLFDTVLSRQDYEESFENIAKTINEYAIVVASSKISNVPKGSIGTVVRVYENKEAYEVEFIVNDSSVVETVSINQIDEKQ